MEPPAKRPKLGPALLDDEDPDEDELVSRPEEVNARRDPGLRFERSRAHAAFKLKSAFESIFEKYEKDFTGIGDEIDLRTGRIVVNNGHLQSLQDAKEMEQEDDEDDDEDDNNNEPGFTGQNVSLPEPQLPPLQAQQVPFAPMSMSSFFDGGWPGMPPTMGYHPPMIPNMMYAGYMHHDHILQDHMYHGPFPMPTPMPYGLPSPVPTLDPAWQTPGLPGQIPYGGPTYASVADPRWHVPQLPPPVDAPRTPMSRKKPRKSLTTAAEGDVNDADDILAEDTPRADPSQAQEKPEEVLVRKKVLLRRPPSEDDSAKGKTKGKSPKAGPEVAHQPKPPARRRPSKKDLGTQVTDTTVQVEGQEHLLAELTPSDPNSQADAQGNSDGEMNAEKEEKSLPVRSRRIKEAPIVSKDVPETAALDVYLDISKPEAKSARKPQNQSLLVEIISRGTIDVSSFRSITPEPEPEPEGTVSEPQETPSNGECSAGAAESKIENEATTLPDANKPATSNNEKKILPSPPVEVFSRNTIDVDYGFSDEDEPLPKRRQPAEYISETVDKEAVSKSHLGVEPNPGNADPEASTLQEMLNEPEIPPSRAEEIPAPPPPVVQVDACRNPSPCLPNQTEPREASSIRKMPSPKITHSSRKKSGTERVRTRWLPRRLSRGPIVEIPDSDPIGDTGAQQDLYETIKTSSPTFPPVEADDEVRRAPSPTLSSKEEEDEPVTEAVNSDSQPHQSPGEQIVQGESQSQHTAQSPVPSHEPLEGEVPSATPKTAVIVEIAAASSSSVLKRTEPKPPVKTKAAKPAAPSTPIKTPTHHHQTTRKSQSRPSVSKTPATATISTTTTTTSTTTTISAKRKNNILSLLSDSEDELSAMSPLGTTTTSNKTPTVRSSPASHHVRLFPPSFTNHVPFSYVVGKSSALKRDALMNSASKASSGSKSKRKKSSRGVSGSASGRSSGFAMGTGMNMSTVLPPGTPSSSASSSSSSKGFMSGGGLGGYNDFDDDLVVQTPGGTMRRCGEDGFRCDRDFCFSCL